MKQSNICWPKKKKCKKKINGIYEKDIKVYNTEQYYDEDTDMQKILSISFFLIFLSPMPWCLVRE